MKIIGGDLRGRNFFMPSGIRPTQGLVRKAVFDILGQSLEGVAFLDLFAGSGAIGLEAFSRGAKHVVWVENDSRCAEIINQNITALNIKGYESKGRLVVALHADSFATVKGLHRQGKRFDIIFADPPYSLDLAKKTLKLLTACDIVHPNSLLIIQHEKKEVLPEESGRFSLVRSRKYGQSVLSLYEVRQI